jgi:hypothetical protein
VTVVLILSFVILLIAAKTESTFGGSLLLMYHARSTLSAYGSGSVAGAGAVVCALVAAALVSAAGAALCSVAAALASVCPLAAVVAALCALVALASVAAGPLFPWPHAASEASSATAASSAKILAGIFAGTFAEILAEVLAEILFPFIAWPSFVYLFYKNLDLPNHYMC